MRPRPVVVLVLLALLVSGCAFPRGSAPDDPVPERLRERETSFLAAVGERDADGVAEHFAMDGVLHVADVPPVRGREAIREFYGNVFAFMISSEANPQPARIAGSGDIAYGIGTVENAFRSEDGPLRYTGKYVLVWETRGGDWEVAVYSLSGDGPGGDP